MSDHEFTPSVCTISPQGAQPREIETQFETQFRTIAQRNKQILIQRQLSQRLRGLQGGLPNGVLHENILVQTDLRRMKID